MPLEKGSSNKTIGKNIAELDKSYKKTGKLGNSHPKSAKKAHKQEVAIAMAEAGKAKKESYMPKFNALVENYAPEEHEDPTMNNINCAIKDCNEMDCGQFEAFFSKLADAVQANNGKEGNCDLNALVPKLKECADIVAKAAGI